MKLWKALAASIVIWLAVTPVVRAAPPSGVQQEIEHLLRYIGTSGCEFKRNGVWNTATAAEAHVRSKYNFLSNMGQIATARDFIDKAATQSNLSGEPYEIRCGDHPVLSSSTWLNTELARYQIQRNSATLRPRVFALLDELHRRRLAGRGLT